MKLNTHIIFTGIFAVSMLLIGCNEKSGAVANAYAANESEDVTTSFNISETSKRKCSPAGLMLWVEDPQNHLRQKKNIGELTYTIQYKPAQYILCKEYDEFSNMPADSIIMETKQLNEMNYFNIKVEIDGFNDEFIKYNLSQTQSYEDRVKYFSYAMQNDLKLVDGEDTLNCVLFHFERTFNVAPYAIFMAAFPNKNKDKITSKTFIYNDKYLGSGSVKFLLKATDLKEIPTLSL